LSQLFAEAMEATERRLEESKRSRSEEGSDAADAALPSGADDDDFEFDMEVESTSADIRIDFLGNGITLADDNDDEAEPTEQDADKPDTASQIEKLLASSFGPPISDDDPSLAFPDFGDENENENKDLPNGALAAMNGTLNGAVDANAAAAAQQAATSLRRQLNQVSRALSEREYELETAQNRVATLEAQLILGARKSVNVDREFHSFRRRSEREQDDVKKFAVDKVLKEFISVLDNLERAMEHAGEHRDTALGQGVVMTLEQFIAVLKRTGASRIQPEAGDLFDPSVHEAMGQEQHETVPVSHIIRTLQGGLDLNGRLVRAAMVVVSTGDGQVVEPSDEAPPAEASEETQPVKKKKRRKRRKKPTDGTADEGVQAAADGTETAAPKRKRRKKRKRKAREGTSASAESEQSSSEGDES